MVSLSYVKTCFVICYLVLILIINAVAELTLAQYFGTDKVSSSKSDRFVRDCDTEEMQSRCYKECGPNHACLPGQCICFKNRASTEEVSDKELQQDESCEENNRGAEISNEDESSSRGESNSVEEKLLPVPGLRHHIAHFCPNLDIARICIRKCMELHLPAFCGKDHVCYCGHQDEYSIEVGKLNPNQSEPYNPFQDLYERYFGKKSP